MGTNNTEDDLFFNEVGNYCLNNDKVHDVQFIVGEQKEKIKAVKIMLINQSRTWWSMLSEESPLAEKGDIALTDIDPEVFNLLLKHSYGGLDSLDDLSDEMVVKLCYCANKYFMTSLFRKISTRLTPKSVDDLFPALHCFIYYNLQDVEDNVKKIIQTQTTKVLNHPEFLECDVDSITYICKQERLNCDELTLWKAVVAWAKHKAQSDEGSHLRQWIASPLQHIRLVTLNQEDLQNYVFSLEVLNSKEISSICKGDPSLTPSLCGEIMLRLNGERIVNVDIVQKAGNRNDRYGEIATSTSCLLIKDKSIVLQSLVIRGYISSYYMNSYKEHLYQGQLIECSIYIKITRVSDTVNNISDELAIIDLKKFPICIFEKVTIPTLIGENGIILQANSKYKIELSFGLSLPCWTNPDCVEGHEFEHGAFYCSFSYNNGVGQTPCHILQFTYKVADDLL